MALCGACMQPSSTQLTGQSRVQSSADDCDNPDADVECCFAGIPPNLSAVMAIADTKEPGERLIISGTVFKADGKTPYPGLILYAYHTDNTGRYSKSGKETGIHKRHGRLHGWCKTDSRGHYEIHSIRPAHYPGNTIPAHIHAAVKTPAGESFYINDFVFSDDSLVDERYLSRLRGIGGNGVVSLKKDGRNTWTGKRDIIVKK